MSALVVLFSVNNLIVQYGCLVVVLMYLAKNYIQRIKGYYVKRTSVGSFASKISSGWTKVREMDMMQEIDRRSEDYEKLLKNRRLQAYFAASMFYFIARRAKEAHRSGIVDMYLALSLIWTIALTIAVFAIVNYGVYTIDVSHYNAKVEVTIFTFLAYSFSEFMLRDVGFISPNSSVSFLVSYIQLTTTLIVVFLVVGIILASARDRYIEDIENVIQESDRVIVELEATFTRLFDGSVNDVEQIVFQEMHGTSEKFAVFIMKLRHGNNFPHGTNR